MVAQNPPRPFLAKIDKFFEEVGEYHVTSMEMMYTIPRSIQLDGGMVIIPWNKLANKVNELLQDVEMKIR